MAGYCYLSGLLRRLAMTLRACRHCEPLLAASLRSGIQIKQHTKALHKLVIDRNEAIQHTLFI